VTSSEIRNSFLKYFEDRQHTIVSSSPVIPFEDPTLLFTNAGMNQFKDVFLGTGRRSYTRAVDTQKCIRVSGKHNDLEEVGRDTYHHTFFEMLGNWSFGDYYKKEAIAWAWDLLTREYGLPKNRLWATVYTKDDEAELLWKTVTDIDPNHVLRFGEKDNFWEMGETGPCGPCSEIHIDRTPHGTATASMVNAGVAEVIEIWNLVFIQYNRDETGTLTSLPAKHVDTGLGFERLCAVLQGKKSNYDTDVFTPIIQKISTLTNKPYDGRLESPIPNPQSELDIAMRVIADHVRTLAFAIGDGAIPSNEGRGYVLRRILRRAARFGRNLGMREPFIFQLIPTLVETMSYIFPEIKSHQEHIQKIIKAEEESFNATLDRGLEKFEEVIQLIGHSKSFPGEDAFKLYDTFGFPLDLTELMASERGLNVDVGTFTELMQKQKERSRDSGKSTGPQTAVMFSVDHTKVPSTEFLGYTQLESSSTVVEIVDGYAILDKTPFYGESGGQCGDTGILAFRDITIPVLNTLKDGTVIGHQLEAALLQVGQSVKAQVDKERRLSIMRNHSATHLLHNALRRILGTHVQQAGSLVGPDYFRFDFAHFAKLSEQELSAVETLVNEKIREDIKLTHHRDIPFEEAKKLGALMFFGDKYGDRVNVVQFGDFSKEFCGGTHVSNTGEIGFLKITSEGSIASGVRRIEAVTHHFALEYLRLQEKSYIDRVDKAFEDLNELSRFKSELAAVSDSNEELLHNSFGGYEQRLADLKELTPVPAEPSPELAFCFEQLNNRDHVLEELVQQLVEEKKLFEKEIARFRIKSLTGSMDDLIASAVPVGGIRLVTANVGAASMDELKSLGDALRAKLGSGVGLLASIIEEKVQLVCVVTDDLVAAKRIEAGKIIGTIAKIVGGGGGGRPHMATAGGKDVHKINEALTQTLSVVKSLLRT